QVIFEISNKRLGVTAVLEEQKIIGIITDGDIRRMLEHTTNFGYITAKDIMTAQPKTIDAEMKVEDALNIMESHKITQLVVTNNGDYAGIIHLHDIRSEEHTSELQSRENLVCRLLLEKKNIKHIRLKNY